MIMATVQRAIDDVNPGVTFTPEGYALVWLRIVDPSRLYDYGTHTAEVPVQTATDPAALATLIGKPVTMDHPADFVGPNTIRHLRHGTVLAAEVVGTEPYAQVQIETPELLAHGRACGWRLTCSPGYDFSEAPSEVADFAQTDRRYNHLAICVSTQPRGGSRCRTILTATDGVPVNGAPLERDKLIARLLADGVPEDKAGILADEIIAMAAPVKVEIEDMAGKPDPAMDAKAQAAIKAANDSAAAVRKAADAQVKAADARAAAAEKRAQDAEIARAGERVRRAADGLGLGKDATDVQKLAEQVAEKCGVPRKGMDAVAFAEGLGFAQKPGKSAADGAWRLNPENGGKPKGTDSEPSTSDTWEQ